MSISVNLVANEGLFKGLAKQNLLFHQCIGELVDNSIAGTIENRKFDISIIFNLEQEGCIAHTIGGSFHS